MTNIIEEFENKFVADNVIDCIPRKNWEEMKGEVETFINQALSQRDKEWEEKIEKIIPPALDLIDFDMNSNCDSNWARGYTVCREKIKDKLKSLNK